MTKQEAGDAVKRWGTLVGLIVAFFVLVAAIEARGDDRYVRRVDYEKDLGQIKSDVRVIRTAICADRPQACQP